MQPLCTINVFNGEIFSTQRALPLVMFTTAPSFLARLATTKLPQHPLLHDGDAPVVLSSPAITLLSLPFANSPPHTARYWPWQPPATVFSPTKPRLESWVAEGENNNSRKCSGILWQRWRSPLFGPAARAGAGNQLQLSERVELPFVRCVVACQTLPRSRTSAGRRWTGGNDSRG